MTAAVVLVVGSALLHLSWNAAVRRQSGRLRFLGGLQTSGGLVLLLASVPSGTLFSAAFWRAWPYLAATSVLHALYFYALGRAYRETPLAPTYNTARGVGILATGLLGWLVLHQALRPVAWAGLALIAGGVGLLSWRRGTTGPPVLVWTLVVGGAIALYTLVDGAAVRLVSPLPYAAVMFLGSAALLAPGALADRDPVPVRAAILAGVGSTASYGLMLFAYRLGPVAPLLALRQLAPSLAPLWGWWFLGERPSLRICLSTGAVVVGSLLMVWP
ncbi:MAG: DMT family transporter [Actinomycetia bacterium]|nr:DMT family transporter [Actinomycetes bacterium]